MSRLHNARLGETAPAGYPTATHRAGFARQTLNVELGRLKLALDAAHAAFLARQVTGGEHAELCHAALEAYVAAIDRPIVLKGLAEDPADAPADAPAAGGQG